jgi:hypothetical protein
MRRAEIERILLDPQALRRFSRNAAGLRSSISASAGSSNPARKVRSAGQTPLFVRASPDVIRANDRANIRRRGIFAGIGQFCPELANQNALQALSTLIEEYQNSPSEAGQYLAQDAINRLTLAGELDRDSRKAVSKAVDVLTSVRLPGQAENQPKDSIFSNLYEHSDFRGRSMFAYLGPDAIYAAVQKSYLELVDLHDRISSLKLNSSLGESRGDVILFQDERFFGRFTALRTNANPTQEVAASYIGDFINDRTSSLMLVRRFGEESTRALGDPITKALIGNIVAGAEGVKELRGDPVFTWDMWPTGGDSHPNDPDKRFIQIKVPVEIEVNNWFNYNAEIWLWFYLYIDGGFLRGYLAYYGAEVEGGIVSGSVLEDIMAALPEKFGEIETTLATFLETINGASRLPILGPFTSVYLLPGDQTQFTGQFMEGNVSDNVTVVLTRRRIVNQLPNSSVILV